MCVLVCVCVRNACARMRVCREAGGVKLTSHTRLTYILVPYIVIYAYIDICVCIERGICIHMQCHVMHNYNTHTQETADNTRILYGGSVTPESVDDLMAMPDIDGLPLVFFSVFFFRTPSPTAIYLVASCLCCRGKTNSRISPTAIGVATALGLALVVL